MERVPNTLAYLTWSRWTPEELGLRSWMGASLRVSAARGERDTE